MLIRRSLQTTQAAEPDVARGHLDVVLVDIDRIRPTEEIDVDRVETLATEIAVSGIWTHPVLLEEEVLAVMDGHHRYQAAKRIGLRSIPAVLLSYDDPRVRLEAWRPEDSYTPEEIRSRAQSGRLLPYKSTRHVTEFPVPQVRTDLGRLREPQSHGSPLSPAVPHPSRAVTLTPFYHQLTRRMNVRADAAGKVEVETPDTQVPHPLLRRMLQADPAMAALLPVAPGRIVLGGAEDSPFFLKRSGLLHLPPPLLGNPSALAVAARWGLEASHLQSNGLLSRDVLEVIIAHGMALLAGMSIEARELLLEQVPEQVRYELVGRDSGAPSDYLLTWQASRIEAMTGLTRAHVEIHMPDELGELSGPVEHLMIAGGDSRLVLDPRTGFNRYGTTPRPRPEAVHFSSSTASSVSDYGFMFCDMLRRDLLAAKLRERCDLTGLRERAGDAMGQSILDLLRLTEDEADLVFAPSGTDAELLTVMMSLAVPDAALTNVIVAPHETGTGVKEAGEGRYFDPIAATGAPIKKGQPAWPGRDITMVEVGIRDANGTPIPDDIVVQRMRDETERALAEGRRVLVHVLASSKTGLSRPSEDSVDALVALAPDRIDVVVDACQMRARFEHIGEWVRRGWMVQITGSKFLTGPPFSGALVTPASLRDRADEVRRLLEAAPGVGLPSDWNAWWRDRLTAVEGAEPPSFGTIFRWLPAVLEARLLEALPHPLLTYGFDRFRRALNERLSQSEWLILIEDPLGADAPVKNDYPDLATSSIVSFMIATVDWNGRKRFLQEAECRRIFQLLNLDVGDQLGWLTSTEQSVARLQAHVGQPVVLARSGGEDRTVLRMVLGARFFNIIGHAGPGSVEAALESEIADALRALDKLELLAGRWTRLKRQMMH